MTAKLAPALADEAAPANDNSPAPRSRRRSQRLRIIEPLQLPADWEMRSGVPETRADCANVPRPCPYVACRHHLWLRLKQEQPGNPQAGKQGETTFRPSSMQSCSLDVADKLGGASFDEIGELLGMDSTRARQIAQAALDKLRAAGVDVDELVEAL
jgi:hypothetical protein